MENTIKKQLGAVIDNGNGRVGWVVLWALGVPIPVLIILYLIRGCT